MNAFVGGEEKRPVNLGQIGQVGKRDGPAAVDVLEERGTRGCPVRLPEVLAAAAVIGGEIRDPVYAHEISGIGASRRQVNILDQDRAGRCAVACPQLLAVSAV